MYGQNNPYSQYPYTGYAYPNYGQRNFMQPQQPMGQPQTQVQQQPMQPTMPTLCYAKMEEAKPYIITNPNSSILFIDKNAKKALLKSTDNGCTSYSQYFDFVETDENGNPLQRQEPTPQVDFGQFAKKEELNGFVTLAQYNDLVQQLETMKKIVASVNSPKSHETAPSKGNAQPSK